MNAATHIGTCPACFRPIAVDGGVITRHGWTEHGGRRVGEYGRAWHTGSCFGVGYLPFEHSAAGTIAFIEQSIFPSALAAANEIARLERRPMLVASISRGRDFGNRERAPLLVERAPGDLATTTEHEGRELRVPAYDDLLASHLAEARAWLSSTNDLGARLTGYVATWAYVEKLQLARGPVVHFAARRGVYCDMKRHGAPASGDVARVTCARCLKAIAASDAARHAREALDADIDALVAWLAARSKPATKAEIKTALSWDTKRLNRVLDHGFKRFRCTYTIGKPDTFSAAPASTEGEKA